MESEQTDEQTEEQLADDEGRMPNVVNPRAAEFPIEDSNELPDWVNLPGDLDIPKGAPVGFLKFKAAWTVSAFKGDRQCVVWPLTDLDERVAYARVRDNIANAANELSKQMLRAVDGHKINWGVKGGEPGNPHDFWREIGPGCRSLVIRYYNRMHVLDADEVAYFLEHCVAVRTMS